MGTVMAPVPIKGRGILCGSLPVTIVGTSADEEIVEPQGPRDILA